MNQVIEINLWLAIGILAYAIFGGIMAGTAVEDFGRKNGWMAKLGVLAGMITLLVGPIIVMVMWIWDGIKWIDGLTGISFFAKYYAGYYKKLPLDHVKNMAKNLSKIDEKNKDTKFVKWLQRIVDEHEEYQEYLKRRERMCAGCGEVFDSSNSNPDMYCEWWCDECGGTGECSECGQVFSSQVLVADDEDRESLICESCKD